MAYIWSARTNKGRVVYKRRPHPFTIYRAARIAVIEYNKETFEQNHFAPWDAIGRLSILATTTILRHTAVIVRPPVTNDYTLAVKLHWYLTQMKPIADAVMPKIPFVGQVWDIGGKFIDWAIESLGKIVGHYSYDPVKDVITWL
jgi:hypothetical protein